MDPSTPGQVKGPCYGLSLMPCTYIVWPTLLLNPYMSIFIIIIIINLLIYFLATLRSLQDLSSLTRDRTQAPVMKVLSPNH